jgi:Flp pilus assembly protein TadG
MAALMKTERRNQRGQAVIEMALTLPLLLVVVFGIIDFGFMFQRYEVVTNAAREGARLGILPDYTAIAGPNNDQPELRAIDYLNGAGISGNLGSCGGGEVPRKMCAEVSTSTVTITGTSPAVSVTQVTMVVEYDHEHSFVGPILKLLGGNLGTVRLRAASSMRKE